MDQMDQDERVAIAAYKEYANRHLGHVDTLSSLLVTGFDIDAYSHIVGDSVDKLTVYVNELERFTRVLVRAADLRQQHYVRYKHRAGEDKGHRHWRIGMNQAAAHAQETLAFWTAQ